MSAAQPPAQPAGPLVDSLEGEWQRHDDAEHAAVDAAVREEQEAEAAAEAKAEQVAAEARRALQRYEVLVQYGIPTVEAADFVLRDTSPEVDQAVIDLSDRWEYEPATNAAIVAEILGSAEDAETAAMVDAVPASISVVLEIDMEALTASVQAQQDAALMAAQDVWEDTAEEHARGHAEDGRIPCRCGLTFDTAEAHEDHVENEARYYQSMAKAGQAALDAGIPSAIADRDPLDRKAGRRSDHLDDGMQAMPLLRSDRPSTSA